MLSGWHLSRFDRSSAAILQPFLHLDEVESDILSELEMGDGVGCVLPGSVVHKRDRHSEQVSELWGSEKVIQRGTPCLGGMETRELRRCYRMNPCSNCAQGIEADCGINGLGEPVGFTTQSCNVRIRQSTRLTIVAIPYQSRHLRPRTRQQDPGRDTTCVVPPGRTRTGAR